MCAGRTHGRGGWRPQPASPMTLGLPHQPMSNAEPRATAAALEHAAWCVCPWGPETGASLTSLTYTPRCTLPCCCCGARLGTAQCWGNVLGLQRAGVEKLCVCAHAPACSPPLRPSSLGQSCAHARAHSLMPLCHTQLSAQLPYLHTHTRTHTHTRKQRAHTHTHTHTRTRKQRTHARRSLAACC
jgi:hypothetical protein